MPKSPFRSERPTCRRPSSKSGSGRGFIKRCARPSDGRLQRMPTSISARLSLMMFLNYVIWGAWYVTIGTYLTATLKFSGTQAGAVFGTTALASMITPFFMGLIADRFLATQKLLAILHLLGAVILFFVTRATSFGAVYALMLMYCLCYFPT